MSDKFDMHVARKICGLAEPRTSRARSMILGHLAEHPLMSKDRIESTIDAAELLPAALDRIEEQHTTIESLKTAIISDRTELVLYSPDYIVWRYHNDIDKIESQDDWEPLEVEAKAQLAREYPEIFGDLK